MDTNFSELNSQNQEFYTKNIFIRPFAVEKIPSLIALGGALRTFAWLVC
jgi:hypothetical protein